MQTVALSIPRLPEFDRANLGETIAAFAGTPALNFSEPWRASPSNGFRPGEVRLGWRDAELFFLARLVDEDVFTRATHDNELVCELGDTFEIFAREEGEASYIELHTAPNGVSLRLLWPGSSAFQAFARTRPLDHRPFVNAFDPYRPRVSIEDKAWSVYGGVTFGSDRRRSLLGRKGLVSFGRYDASHDGSPTVLSSTSSHPVPDFHRQEEWQRVRFV